MFKQQKPDAGPTPEQMKAFHKDTAMSNLDGLRRRWRHINAVHDLWGNGGRHVYTQEAKDEMLHELGMNEERFILRHQSMSV